MLKSSAVGLHKVGKEPIAAEALAPLDDRFVPAAVLHPSTILRDAKMAGLEKLRCGIRLIGGGPLWTVYWTSL